MKKLLFRKFYKDILKFFLASLMLVGLIVWTIQAVNYFDFVTEDGHGLKVYFYFSVLNFPKIIERIAPFIFCISTLYIITNYELKNELLIFWINGIDKINFLNKLLTLSVIIMIFQFILVSYISPLSKLKARDFLKNSNIDFFTSLIKEGKFINIAKNLTIFIEKKRNDGSYEDIFLEDARKKSVKMIYASRGFTVNNKSQKIFKLYDGRVINIEKSKINLFDFEQIDFNLNDLNSNTITVPKIQEINTKILLSCIFNYEIDNIDSSFKCREDLIGEIKTEILKRLFKPLYIPIIILFSAYLILYSKNNRNYKLKRNLIFLLTIVIILISEVSISYSSASEIFTITFLMIPLIIFIFGYYYFYRLSKHV